jgi:hypothetical protein
MGIPRAVDIDSAYSQQHQGGLPMSLTANLMVKINGSPELVAHLEGVVKENATDMKLESVGPAQEASHLGFGLAEVATIIAIVNGVATLAKFAYAIYNHLKDKPAERVTIQTPLRTIEILSSDAVSEERIRQLLSTVVRT